MSTRTTEEKIRLCIGFLEQHGYRVIVNTNPQRSSVLAAQKMAKQRQEMLTLSGVSAVTLLSKRDVAAMLGCSGGHVTDLVKRKDLAEPVIKVHHHYRWALADVKAYVARSQLINQENTCLQLHPSLRVPQ